jgi:hypothetical protein
LLNLPLAQLASADSVDSTDSSGLDSDAPPQPTKAKQATNEAETGKWERMQFTPPVSGTSLYAS